MSASFKDSQRQFIAHIRDPENNPGPADVEDRRMGIYRNLIYNNIEGFLDSGFPILRELFSEKEWQSLVREFIIQHQCHSPYFLEISQEFLSFLQQRNPDPTKPFLVELAHYEWVELALDCSTESIPQDLNREGDYLADHPIISPLVWNLSYQYPVHQISLDNQPLEPTAVPSFLLVYRNREDRVHFMESNAATSRLITLLEGESKLSGRAALMTLAEELKAPDPQAIISFGADLFEKLVQADILCGFEPATA